MFVPVKPQLRFSPIQDLKSLSVMLGDRSFFLGNSGPSAIDCALFGHLVQFLYIPMEFPQKQFLKDVSKGLHLLGVTQSCNNLSSC